MRSDVPFASCFEILERCTYTVASRKAPCNICLHEPVDFDRTALHIQAWQEICRRKRLPKKEYPIRHDGFSINQAKTYSASRLFYTGGLPRYRFYVFAEKIAVILWQKNYLLSHLSKIDHIVLLAFTVGDNRHSLTRIYRAVTGGTIADTVTKEIFFPRERISHLRANS